MNIVVDGIIFEKNPHGGIARIFNNILPIMCDMDPKLKITLFLRKNNLTNVPKHHQITTISLGVVEKFRPLRLWKPYHKTIQKLIYRIHSENSDNKIWLSTYFTRPPINWKGKEVVWVYDMIYELFPRILPNSTSIINKKRESIEKADEIYCISNATEMDLHRIYGNTVGKTHVIHLSHDHIFKMNPNKEIKSEIPNHFILFIGSRSRYKGFKTLLEAYSDWEKKDKVKLVAVGRPWNAEEENLIVTTRLTENIVLYESVSDEFLNDLYNNAEAFVYPSIYEGFGIPLLEAMACGCPVIASRIPSTVEIAREVPIYFEPNSTESLKIALNRLLTSKSLSERITLGINRASEFSWEKSAKSFYMYLKELNVN